MSSPMCVKGRDKEWHAIVGPLDPDAWEDALRCGGFMVMRFDSARRAPTCPDCRKHARRDSLHPETRKP